MKNTDDRVVTSRCFLIGQAWKTGSVNTKTYFWNSRLFRFDRFNTTEHHQIDIPFYWLSTPTHTCAHTLGISIQKKPLTCVWIHITSSINSPAVRLSHPHWSPRPHELKYKRPSSTADYSLITPTYGFHYQIKSSWKPINSSYSMRSLKKHNTNCFWCS